MKITISGRAAAFDSASKKEITLPESLEKLDGIVYNDDSCCKYLEAKLGVIGLIGGLVRIVYDAPSQSLRVVTEYHSPRRLKPAELKALIKETTGQWTDGIGESYFWQDVRPGVTIEMLPTGADEDLRSEQVDDGVKVPVLRTSPLLKAVENGDLEKVRKLLLKGENVNARDKRGKPALHLAIFKKHFEVARLLIEHGADVKIQDAGYDDLSGQTPLHVIGGSPVELVETLLDKGAEVDARDSWGWTPLMWVGLGGFADIAKVLIGRGADVNARDTKEHNEGHTPLMHTHHVDVINLLLAHGADPNIRNHRGLTAYEAALFQAGALSEPVIVRCDRYERWIKPAEMLLAAIRERAGNGDAASQYTLAEYHERGLTMPKNPTEAFRGFEQSAANGYRLALCRLGICHRQGIGSPVDETKAQECFRRAADAGVPLAMGILGECYAEGKVVTKNLDEAVKWFRRGAEMDPAADAQPTEIFAFRQGVGGCRAELGACYDEGKGVARDTQEALKWYQAALDIGFHHVKPAIEKLQTASRT